MNCKFNLLNRATFTLCCDPATTLNGAPLTVMKPKRWKMQRSCNYKEIYNDHRLKAHYFAHQPMEQPRIIVTEAVAQKNYVHWILKGGRVIDLTCSFMQVTMREGRKSIFLYLKCKFASENDLFLFIGPCCWLPPNGDAINYILALTVLPFSRSSFVSTCHLLLGGCQTATHSFIHSFNKESEDVCFLYLTEQAMLYMSSQAAQCWQRALWDIDKWWLHLLLPPVIRTTTVAPYRSGMYISWRWNICHL